MDFKETNCMGYRLYEEEIRVFEKIHINQSVFHLAQQ